MALGPSRSVGRPDQLVYPDLLPGIEVSRTDQVGSTDIEYIRLVRGFVHLVAIIDWCSPRVLAEGDQQQPGHLVPRRLSGSCVGSAREAGDLQPRLSPHATRGQRCSAANEAMNAA